MISVLTGKPLNARNEDLEVVQFYEESEDAEYFVNFLLIKQFNFRKGRTEREKRKFQHPRP